MEEFTKCAVSDKGCVPQRKDGDREYPIPPDRDLVTNFDLSEFKVHSVFEASPFLFLSFVHFSAARDLHAYTMQPPASIWSFRYTDFYVKSKEGVQYSSSLDLCLNIEQNM